MEKIINYLEINQKRFIDELCQYVRFPSISAQPERKTDVQACAEWLVKHCEELGLEANLRQTGGHPVVVAKTPRHPNRKLPHFVVYGHYDVQPEDPLEEWHSP